MCGGFVRLTLKGMESADRKSRTVSTKVKPEELKKLDDLALEWGVTGAT